MDTRTRFAAGLVAAAVAACGQGMTLDDASGRDGGRTPAADSALGVDAPREAAPGEDVAPATDEGPGPDAAADETGAMDAGAGDTGATDAGRTDAVTPDTARPDAGGMDVARPDTATPDTGTPDVPRTDAGGTDTVDGGGGTRLCTAAGDTNVVAVANDSRFPSTAWTGTEYGIAWQDNRHGNWEVYFARVTSAGVVRGEQRVTNDATASETSDVDMHVSLTWDGARYWVAWDRRATSAGPASIRAVALTPSGAGVTVGTPVTVSTVAAVGTSRPSAVAVPAASGGGVAIAWSDGRATDNSEIYFARLDAATGARVGAEVRVTNAPRNSTFPLLAWNSRDREFGLLWEDDRDGAGPIMYPNEELYFTRLTPSGARPAGAVDARITNDIYRSFWASIAFDGAGYGISWANEHDEPDLPIVFFTRIDAQGAVRGSHLRVSTNPVTIGAWTNQVAWSGTEYLVLFEDQRHNQGDLMIQRISPSGERIGVETWLADDEAWSAYPHMIFGNNEYFLAWEDDRNGSRDIWFRRLGRADCR